MAKKNITIKVDAEKLTNKMAEFQALVDRLIEVQGSEELILSEATGKELEGAKKNPKILTETQKQKNTDEKNTIVVEFLPSIQLLCLIKMLEVELGHATDNACSSKL